MASSNLPTLTYFDIAGRAEPIRLAAAVGAVEINDERLTGAEFGARKAQGDFTYGSLPIFRTADGRTLAQAHAILRYVARSATNDANLYPQEDAFAASEIDEVLNATSDLNEKLYAAYFQKDAEKKAALVEDLIAVQFPKFLGPFERKIEAAVARGSNSGYLVGDSITLADLVFFTTAAFITSGAVEGLPEAFAHFTRLSQLKDAVAAEPTVAAYYA